MQGSDDQVSEFRRSYAAYRAGASKGAKGEPGITPRKRIQSNAPLARSQILPHDPEADELRARFHADWGKVLGHSLVEGSLVTSPSRAPVAGRSEDHKVPSQNHTRIAVLAALALVCGTSCQLCVELLIDVDPRMGDVISATEYTYCALLSSAALLSPRRLPWRCHLQLWAVGIAHSLLTNIGLGVRELPMAVALVIKNGSLLANMLVGRLVGKIPSRREMLAAGIISAGLVLGTLGRGGDDGGGDGGGDGEGGGGEGGGGDGGEGEGGGGEGLVSESVRASYTLGVLCLGGALLARASSGLLQERIFSTHGVAYNEVLFWRATLGAPVFLFTNLRAAAVNDGAASSVWSDVLSSHRVHALLATNVVGDHLCKLAVTRLIGESGSLLATVVICVQRFASCVISAAVLAPTPPPPSLWVAIACVAAGSLASIPPPLTADDPEEAKEEPKEEPIKEGPLRASI